MEAQVAAFVSRRWSVEPRGLHVDVQPLHGGLESAVSLARIASDAKDRSVPSRLVVKELRAGFEREAVVYAWLWNHLERPPAVRLLGQERVAGRTFLYLEDAQSFSPWPWSDARLSAAVCRELAQLHDNAGGRTDALAWDYEAGLASSAELTLQVALAARNASSRRHWRRLGDLRKIVADLHAIRSRLLGSDTSLIHGDMHPGNVVLRRGHPDPEVVLIDWGRARIGSPLEDVASWLHSLGCWEPQARSRHDSLMRAYLEGRRVRRSFTSEVRVEYWFACASNGLAGAIRYHLAVLSDAQSSEAARYDSQRALVAWQRVVRRASSLLRTSSRRCM